MSIGSRIRFIRKKKGLTQKELGIKLGFKESTAEVRIAQYETGERIPREDLLKRIADTLEVNVGFLNPDTRTVIGKMQLFFALEDDRGLGVKKIHGHPVLFFQEEVQSDEGLCITLLMQEWAKQAERLRKGEITQDEYDNWRYNLK